MCPVRPGRGGGRYRLDRRLEGGEDLEYDQGVMVLEADDLERLREIMRADADAILVSGEYSNIGCSGTGALPDVQVLADALRWQYEDCHLLISDWDLKEAV